MKIIDIPKAPQAIGPYCHAVKAGSLIFCFGHTPARTTIAVKQNPLDVLVEIECIAEIPE